MGAEGLGTASSISSFIFGTAYLVALGFCIARAHNNPWLKTHLLLAALVHLILRLVAFVLILLKETGVLFFGADIAYLGLWLPGLPILVMGHCAATAIYIAKGSLQTRVSFKPLPIWMKVAFILPHVLLVIAVACGTYGVYSPRACDGLSLTIIHINCVAAAIFAVWKKYPMKTLYFLLGIALLLFIACVYRLAVANYPTNNPIATAFQSGPGSVKADGPVPNIFELAPQCAVTLLWVILPIKRLLNMGVFAHQPAAFEGPTTEELLQQVLQQQYTGGSMNKSSYPMQDYPPTPSQPQHTPSMRQGYPQQPQQGYPQQQQSGW